MPKKVSLEVVGIIVFTLAAIGLMFNDFVNKEETKDFNYTYEKYVKEEPNKNVAKEEVIKNEDTFLKEEPKIQKTEEKTASSSNDSIKKDTTISSNNVVNSYSGVTYDTPNPIASQYTINFDSKGGTSIPSQRIYHYGYATLPTNPTRGGYIFNGWYYNGFLYNFNTPITKNITLSAGWVVKTNYYTVTFNSDGGSSVGAQTVSENTYVNKPTNPTKSGYTFLGWYNNGVLYNFNTPVTKSITLSAKWSLTTNYYTVTFDSNGGNSVGAQTVSENNYASRPTNPTRSGYTFLGWYNNGVIYNFNTPVNKSITLTAGWTKTINYYTVTFNSNGGSSVGSQTISENTYVSRPTNPTRSGYIFDGWYYNGTLYNFNTPITKNITLSASWKANVSYYTVSFDSNGGSYVSSQTVVSGSYASRPANPTRSGYTFDGWYYSGTPYNFNSAVNKNITLSAMWKVNATTTTTNNSTNNTSNPTTNNNPTTSNPSTDKKADYLNQLVRLPSGSYNVSEANNMISRLKMLDERLLKKLVTCKAEIRLINTKITDQSEFAYLRGVVPTGWEGTGYTWDDLHGVTLRNISLAKIGYSFPSSLTKQGSLVLELHEVSHSIDYCSGWISGTTEFRNIHSLERVSMFGSNTYVADVREYFAETLSYYVYNGSTLKSKAPRTYDFFTKMINSLPY